MRGGLPISLNVTVLNGLGVLGYVTDLKWAGSTSVKVEAQYPVTLWPFAGAFGVSISAKPDSKIGIHTGKLWERDDGHEKTGSDTIEKGRWVPGLYQ